MENNFDTSRYKVPNLDRALTIMEYLVKHGKNGATLQQITDDLEFSKNSVFRITLTLVDRGYLSRDDDTKKFFLTRQLLVMGTEALSEQNIISVAREEMRALRDEVKETVLLGTLAGMHGVVLEQILGTHTFKFTLDLGHKFPLHVSAPGKALVAFMPKNEQEYYLNNMSFHKYNEKTITCVDKFKEELSRIKESGYAYDLGEELAGIKCVGAPILDHNGMPIAAIWLTGPESRIDDSDLVKIGERVRQSANAISMKIGNKTV